MENALQPFTGQDIQQVPQQASSQALAPVTVRSTPASSSDQVKQSAWPTIISIAALAAGDAGPLLKLMEQKRKTQVFQAADPYRRQALQLTLKGDFAGAEAILGEGFSKFGSRAPEVAQFFNEAIQHTRSEQIKLNDLKAFVASKEATYGDKNHPSYKAFKGVKDLVKQGTPMSLALVQSAIKGLQPEIQQYENAARVTSPETLEHRTIPYEAVARQTDIQGFVADSIAKEFDLNIDEATNAMNNKPVMRDGKDITPLIRENLRSRVSQLQAQRRDIDLRKLAPTSTQYNEAAGEVLRRKGSADPLADLASGNYSTQDVSEFRRSAQRFAIELAEAPIQAELNRDAFASEKAGIAKVNINAASETFGQQIIGKTHEQTIADPRLKYVRMDVLDKKVTPALHAVRGLEYIDRMFQELDSPDTPLDRLSTGLYRLIGSYTGIALDPKMSAAKAAEAIANRAIERVGETQTIDDATIGQLKSFITGAFSDVSSGKQAGAILRNRLREEISYYLGRNTVPLEDVPKSLTTGEKASQRKGLHYKD